MSNIQHSSVSNPISCLEAAARPAGVVRITPGTPYPLPGDATAIMLRVRVDNDQFLLIGQRHGIVCVELSPSQESRYMEDTFLVDLQDLRTPGMITPVSDFLEVEVRDWRVVVRVRIYPMSTELTVHKERTRLQHWVV